MRKILISLLAVALSLAIGASASAASLQPQASAGSGNSSPEISSSIGFGLLQPVAGTQLTGEGSSPASPSDASLLGADSGQALSASGGLSDQEIMSEADPNPPSNHSNHWIEIVVFTLIGLAVILVGYLTFRRLRTAKTQSR